MLQPVSDQTLMSNAPRATPSLQKISRWIRDAAASESWRPGHHLGSDSMSISENWDFHVTRIQASLNRARFKTFVRMVKPLRRIFRNQGAVNDSLIEAVHHLAAQNEELNEQVIDLREVVDSLRTQLRRSTADDAGVAGRRSTGDIRKESEAREEASDCMPPRDL